ncbi:MAG: transcription elongation factor GreA [Sphaerochaetaceae bacterium]|nr:transcription elongation factor GreA [Sphaerochaetaceae bacterium]MDD2406966.1 transcription elongation factor GreA [Sphaerochaetaceae bacterium]MDD4260199.1 transcription elongation factor GreA [Sphaerochaetaceae bacterium]
MHEEIIKNLLTEEKWTRTTIMNYTVVNFHELDDVIDPIETTDDQLEVKSICDEHLSHNKNSIIALYISGSIALKRHSLDYSNISTLVELFADAKKWNIVEFLSLKVLKQVEDKYLLRVLADCYEKMGREEDKFVMYERLVKVDYEETVLIQSIANRYMTKGNLEKAIFFYKKAMQRFINVSDYSAIKDVWAVFLEKIPEELSYLLGVAQRVSAKLQPERAIYLLNQLYENKYATDEWDDCITVLKSILDLDPKNQIARDRLVECYRTKYAEHGRLDTCLEISNLMQSYRDVHSAIDDFEKNIAFDKGSFVFHKSWGIGRIRELNHTNVVIDFASKRNHSMTLQMAFGSLQVLPKSHIWVLKSVFPKEKLTEKFNSDVEWGLRTLISSHQNAASLKDMKAEMVPSIFTPSEWNSWSSNAKKELMANTMFGFMPNDPDVHTVRTTPISFEEKTLGLFKMEKRFYQKVRTMRDFLANGDPESEFFLEMVRFFLENCTTQPVDDKVISSYLFVQSMRARFNFIEIPEEVTFKDLYGKLESIPETFKAIDDSELKKMFIDSVVEVEEPSNIDKVLVSLYPYYLTSYIMDTLKEHGKTKVIEDMFRKACTYYKENADLFTYLLRTYDRKFWEKKIKVPFEMLVSSALQLLDFALNAVEAKRQTVENRKLAKILNTMLFNERMIFDFLKTCTQDGAQRINFIVQRMAYLEPAKKIEVKHEILERFPSFEFLGENTNEPEMVSSGLLVTIAKLQEKQNELDHVMNVEIPENSKEIGYALSLGDLRENSEFKAAKERQGLLNFTMNKLSDEISRAMVFTQSMVDTSKISFGTKVTLLNTDTGKEETYSILGPWESEPSLGIISYLAPFGAKLLNRTVGERFAFVLNERQYDFTVLSISALTV